MDTTNFERYLKILDVQENKPTFENLSEIIKAQLLKIPFENLSKLYYHKKYNLNYIPNFTQYLDGIEQYHFGGTCYTTNYYLHELLKFLGYDVDLCGANMDHPDVHIANIVKLNELEYIADVGFSSPFLDPIPRNMNSDYTIKSFDNKSYLIKPMDSNGCSSLFFYKDGEYKNAYILKPDPRKITDFKKVIKESYNDNAGFMNRVLITLFGENFSKRLNNNHFEEQNGKTIKKIELHSKSDLIDFIEKKFQIPVFISSFALNNIIIQN